MGASLMIKVILFLPLALKMQRNEKEKGGEKAL